MSLQGEPVSCRVQLIQGIEKHPLWWKTLRIQISQTCSDVSVACKNFKTKLEQTDNNNNTNNNSVERLI